MQINYLTKNKTYTRPSIIKPQYVVVHSTGANTDKKETLYNAWNSPSVDLSCHGMVDADGCMLTLPVNYRGYHVGSKGNGVSVGFEICEPKAIAYVDAAHTKVNTGKYIPTSADVLGDFVKRWKNAVEMAAYLCRETGIGADRVKCHAEMAAMGLATNHADVSHWFPLFGPQYTMDAFRAAVQRELLLDHATTKDTIPTITPAFAVGDKVALKQDAVYGGLSTLRGSAVPLALSGRTFTVKQIANHNGVDEALLAEINSWVALAYLNAV